MRRWQLSKRERKQLSRLLGELYGLDLDPESRVEKLVEDDSELIIIDGVASFIKLEGKYIPHLKILLRRPTALRVPRIVVDQGAVRPIARGADLMRPGIVEIEGDFEAGDVVVVVEPSRRLPLAVHRALYSRDQVETMEKGRVTKRLHHLGDRFWRLAEEAGV